MTHAPEPLAADAPGGVVVGAAGANEAVEIDDDGVLAKSVPAGALVVRFDGQYVWSFTPAKEGRPARGGLLTEWPEALKPYLNGRSVVSVHAADDRVLFSQELVLGEVSEEDGPDQRISIVSRQGYPLSIDKVGHLARSFYDTSDDIKHEILSATQLVLAELNGRCGVEAYLCYGALLGAIRDKAMIGHDSDTDVCYYSHHTDPVDIIRESYRVERELLALGWRVLRMSGADLKVLWELSDERLVQIDIFGAFRVNGTFYQLGNRSGQLPEDVILPLSTVDLEGYEFPAPAQPEKMLAFLYGENWRVPDPSFRYRDPVAGVRRLDGWLRGFRTEMSQWTELYESAFRPRIKPTGSKFARWVRRQLPAGTKIADLGSGPGRDALYFTLKGNPARAYDFSRSALWKVRQRAERNDIEVPTEVLILNETRTVLHTIATLARDPHELYARQLIGCLDEDARRNLWLLGRSTLRHGGSMWLEFSALAPAAEGAPDPEPQPLVRRFDPAWLRSEIEASGGVVAYEAVAPGVDMFENPDPAVCRMRVTWPRPASAGPAVKSAAAAAVKESD